MRKQDRPKEHSLRRWRWLDSDLRYLFLVSAALAMVIMPALGLTTGDVLGETMPWYATTVEGFTIVAAFAATFLATVRYLQHGRWSDLGLGLALALFAVVDIVYLLAWPGIIGNRSVLARDTNTASVLYEIKYTVFIVAVWAALLPGRLVIRPTGRRRFLWAMGVAAAVVLVLSIWAVMNEERLPRLLENGLWLPVALQVSWVQYALLVVAGLLAWERHIVRCDALLGYAAAAIMLVACSELLAGVLSTGRYYIWWYVSRVFQVGGFALLLYGYLAEYPRLYASEQRLRELESRRTELLYDIARSMASTLEPREVLRRLVESAAASVADGVAVFLLRDGVLTPEVTAHRSPNKRAEWHRVMSEISIPVEVGITGRAVAEGEPAFLPDYDPRAVSTPFADLFALVGVHSFIAVPIQRGDRVLGALTLSRTEPGTSFDQSDLALAQGLADAAATALGNATLYVEVGQARAEAEAAVKRLQAIQRVSDTALAHLELDELLRELLTRLREVLAVDTAAILLLTTDRRQLALRASVGIAEEEQREVKVPLGQGIAGRIAASGEPLIIADLATAQVVSPLLRDKIRSLMGAPLLVEGTVTGVIHVGTYQHHTFTTEDLQLLQLVADRIALAIESARLFDEAQYERARWQATVESMVDMVTISNAKGQVVYVNPAYERLIRRPVAPDLELEGHPTYYQLYRPDGTMFEPEDLPLQRAALRGEEVRDVEIVHRAADGREFIGLFSASPLRDANGRVIGAVAVGRDVTEQRRAERLREEYVSIISHDLRQPLTSILGMSDWLRRLLARKGLEQEARTAESLLTSARRMNAMIGEMVDSARLETGQIEMQLKPVVLTSLVAELAERIGTAEDRARIQVEAPQPMPTVMADPEHIERVVANLVTNALKYSAPDKPVTIFLGRSDSEALVSVSDQGVGVPPEDLPHVFDRYYRAKTGKQKADGLGLGLYISRMIVEAHGGRVWAESEEGKGSTFHFSLPASPAT